MIRLLVFSGSSRADSFNSKLAARLAAIAQQHDVSVALANLGDFDMPIYNGDLENTEGLPRAAKQLKRLMLDSTGLIITCPEYNGFMPPLLINAIDWCTRSENASVDLSAFVDRVVLIASASPGPGGASRANTHLRTMLSGIGSIVFPQTLTVPSAHRAFDDQGGFADESMAARAQQTIEKYVGFAGRFK